MSFTRMVRFLLLIFVGLFLFGCAEEQFEANTDLKQFQQVSQNIEKPWTV